MNSQKSGSAPSVATANSSEYPGLPTPQRYYAVAAHLLSTLMCVLDASMINVALPSMSEVLEINPSSAVWIVNAYGLVMVMVLLPFSSLVERYGVKKIYTMGLCTFLVGSLISASSIHLAMLLTGRVIQGVGAAALFCLSAGLIRSIYPTRLLSKGLGLIAMTVATGSVIGPSLGSVILTLAGWRWIFISMIPLGVFIFFLRHNLPPSKLYKRPFDLRSAAQCAAGIGCLILGLDFLVTYTWQSVVLLCLSAVLMIDLTRRSAQQTAPLFPVDLLKIRPFRYAIAASKLTFAAQMAAFVSMPFFLQITLGRSQLTLGWIMAGWPLGAGVMAMVAGFLADRYAIPLLCAMGAGCMALGTLAIALMNPQVDDIWIFLCMVVCGVGFGFFQTPNNRVLLTAAPRERSGALGGTQAVTRVLGQTIGAAIVAGAFALGAGKGPTYGIFVSVIFASLAVALNVYRQIGLSKNEMA